MFQRQQEKHLSLQDKGVIVGMHTSLVAIGKHCEGGFNDMKKRWM
jgi:hypothetical protein